MKNAGLHTNCFFGCLLVSLKKNQISMLENKGNVEAFALSETSQNYSLVSDEICKYQMQLLLIYENKTRKLSRK